MKDWEIIKQKTRQKALCFIKPSKRLKKCVFYDTLLCEKGKSIAITNQKGGGKTTTPLTYLPD